MVDSNIVRRIIIDSVDSSITSNITLVTIRRNLKAVLGQFAQYEVCYGNRSTLKRVHIMWFQLDLQLKVLQDCLSCR